MAIKDNPTYFAHANGISIAYQDVGNPNGPPVVLVMGLSAQLVMWGDTVVDGLVAAGYRVILFDNRDIGLSEKFYQRSRPNLAWQLFKNRALGRPAVAPYKLGDMAADVTGLMDCLGIESAHLAGVSMGGMIAQIVTGTRPERVRSLISIMSSSSARHLPVDEKLLREIAPVRMRGASRTEQIEQTLKMLMGIGSPLYPDEDYLRELLTLHYDRSHYRAGVERQMLAIMASGSRVELLKTIRRPTLVIHGDSDPLVPLPHGEHVAALVPGARLCIIEGMGHNLEPRVSEMVVAEMVPFINAIEGIESPYEARTVAVG